MSAPDPAPFQEEEIFHAATELPISHTAATAPRPRFMPAPVLWDLPVPHEELRACGMDE